MCFATHEFHEWSIKWSQPNIHHEFDMVQQALRVPEPQFNQPWLDQWSAAK